MNSLAQLKVCFLAGTLGQGGAERQLVHILRALCQGGASPSVLCLEQHEFWEGAIQDLGVPVIWVGRAKSKLGRLLRIRTALRHHRASIIQSQHFYTNAYAGAAARMLGRFSIGALRSDGLMEAGDCGRIGGWLNLHTPHLLAANSQAAIQYALQQGLNPTRLFHLANVVDTACFRPATDRHSGPVRLISVGRLIQSKRFDRFISLVARLRKLNDQVSGTLIGAGPLQDSLRAQAAQLGLPKSALELHGGLADSAPVYRQADIFVMTSEFEGTPNVLLEAMASGLPVVATNVGGIPDLIRQGENGFLVDGDDDAGLGAVVKRLIRDPQLRLAVGKNGRAYVQANHSLERLPRMLSALYDRASSRPSVCPAATAQVSPVG